MTYGYIRVSSDKQTVENQRFEINRFCAQEGIEIDGWIEETVSGTKSYTKRRLGKLVKHVGERGFDYLQRVEPLGPKPLHDHGDLELLHAPRM